MVKNLRTEQVEEFSKRRQQKLWIKRGFMVLAVVVMFMTVYGLVLPAVTMEHPDPACGLEEHKHTEACMERQLTCGLEEGPVHVHSQACFDEETGDLTCEIEPATGHMHIDTCFATGDELICENTDEGHVHGEECYAEEGALLCEVEETAHMHRADCFDAAGNLTCESKAAHIHGLTCYKLKEAADDDPAQDTNESDSADGSASSNVILSGAQSAESKDLGDPNAADAPEAQGESQSSDDEPESTTSEAQSDAEPIADNPTPSGDLAAPSAAIADQYVLACEEEDAGHVHFAFCYDEEGNLVCDQEECVMVEHEHSDDCYSDVPVCGIEEHSHDEVCFDAESFQMIQASKDHSAQLAAEEAAEAAKAEGQTPEAVDDAELAALKEKGLAYENENMVMVFQVPEEVEEEVRFTVTEGSAPAAPTNASTDESSQDSNGAEAQGSSQDVILSEAKDLSAADADAATAPQAQDDSQPADETPAWENNLHIEATIDGEPVEDIASLGATVQFQVKEEAVKPILDEINYEEVAEEIKDEVGAEITITQVPTNPEDYAISERPKEQTETFVVTDVSETPAVVYPIAYANFRAAGGGTQNACFTVSYSAYVDTILTADQAKADATFAGRDIQQLTMIDTTGQHIPVNGVAANNAHFDIGIYNAGDVSNFGYLFDYQTNYGSLPVVWEVASRLESKPVYQDQTFHYFDAPNLQYFNILANNGGYEIESIEVIHSCGQPTTVLQGSDAKNAHFTNKPESASDNLILIDNDTHIKINYNCTSHEPVFEATLYDYDITDGKSTSPNTELQGINSASNYSGTGAKYAFGNGPGVVVTGLGEEKLGNYFINQANSAANHGNDANKASDGDCSFGIVKSELDADGRIQFSDGIDAPAVFDNSVEVENTVGKTTYSDYGLVFNQVGDTYTLEKVKSNSDADSDEGVVLNNLGRFISRQNWNKTKWIFSNDFWALDNVESHGTANHDTKHGNAKVPTTPRPSGQGLPESDFGGDHNGYFGMQYEVKFNLIDDYVGPLEYYFFGDDDMWVYLDGKLVCDIGGVHSSAGEYVNLWDYVGQALEGASDEIKNGPSAGKCGDNKEHVLKFYYTERGASGSTCFMRFTLPSVTSAQRNETSSLKVEKRIQGNSFTEDDVFKFDISLKDEQGNFLPDNYSYTKYDENDNQIGEADLIFPSKTEIELQAGQYIVIKYLPLGTRYEIEEKGYQPIVAINGTQIEGSVVSATIPGNSTEHVLFTNNKYELPATGGLGTEAYLLVGGVLLLTGIGWQVRRRYQAAVRK